MKKILVGNLDFGATEGIIRSVFEPFGSVNQVSFPQGYLGSLVGHGFAIVEMTQDQEAEDAIAALNGSRLGQESKNPLFLVVLPPDQESQPDPTRRTLHKTRSAIVRGRESKSGHPRRPLDKRGPSAFSATQG